MKKLLISLLLLFTTKAAIAHDMTPTYPELQPSYMIGLLVADLEVFNKRNDIDFYEIAVFDSEWLPVPFVTSYKIIKLEYLERVRFSVYIRDDDKDRATYVCTKSRTREDPAPTTMISSTICSKFKKDNK